MVEQPPDPGQLNGWKEIAALFGKSTRTVQRWEHQLGLPVHRIKTPGGEILYAFRSELEAWRQSAEGAKGEADESDLDDIGLNGEGEPADDGRDEEAAAWWRSRRALAAGLSIAVVVAAIGAVWLWLHRTEESTAAPAPSSAATDPAALRPGPGLDAGPWPAVGHDSRLSNQSHQRGPANPGEPQLVFEAPLPLGFSAGIGHDDYIIVNSQGQIIMGWAGAIAAIGRDGRRVWTHPLNHPYAEIGPAGFAAAASSITYFAAHSVPHRMVFRTFVGGISRIGEGVFRREQFAATFPPVIGPDGTIYQIDEVCALRAYVESAENRWTTVLAGYAMGGPAIDSRGNLYIGTDGSIYNRTSIWSVAPDGTVRWTSETSGMFSTPAVSLDDRISLASGHGTLVTLRPDGTEVWRRTGLPDAPGRTPLAVSAAGDIFYRHAGGLIRFDRDGQTRWRFASDGDGVASQYVILDVSANVYMASGDTVYSLTPDGVVRWRRALKDPRRLVMGGEGLLYVVGEGRKVYAVADAGK